MYLNSFYHGNLMNHVFRIIILVSKYQSKYEEGEYEYLFEFFTFPHALMGDVCRIIKF